MSNSLLVMLLATVAVVEGERDARVLLLPGMSSASIRGAAECDKRRGVQGWWRNGKCYLTEQYQVPSLFRPFHTLLWAMAQHYATTHHDRPYSCVDAACVRVCVGARAWVRVRGCVGARAWVCACVGAWVRGCVRVCMRACVSIYVCVRVCVPLRQNALTP